MYSIHRTNRILAASRENREGRLGPAATTRLVLYAHSLFMNRDGSNCRVGVRRLAEVTGLDKSTVAEHRAAAISGGWLIGSKQPRGGPSTDLRAALPDGATACRWPFLSDRVSQSDRRGPLRQINMNCISQHIRGLDRLTRMKRTAIYKQFGLCSSPKASNRWTKPNRPTNYAKL
jgi:hypothetical protein